MFCTQVQTGFSEQVGQKYITNQVFRIGKGSRCMIRGDVNIHNSWLQRLYNMEAAAR